MDMFRFYPTPTAGANSSPELVVVAQSAAIPTATPAVRTIRVPRGVEQDRFFAPVFFSEFVFRPYVPCRFIILVFSYVVRKPAIRLPCVLVRAIILDQEARADA